MDQTVNGALNTYADTALSISSNTNNIINVNKLSSLVNTVNKLNSVVSNMYGVVAKWFRAIPSQRSKDVLFHEYTLSNVEDCGFDINIMYTDNNYDDAALQYTMMGIQYQIPLTCEISIDNWNKATNNDGTIPQKNDIVYIPQSNKLYQVVSMNPIRTVASQITSYRCNLAIYKNKASIALNDNLEETINSYTDSVNSIFGNEISNEIIDTIADKQTSLKNNTYIDEYKNVYDKNVIIKNDEIFSGHMVFRNYYKNNSSYPYIVKYNISDIIDDDRCYSLNIKLNEQHQLTGNIFEYYYGNLSILTDKDDNELIKAPNNWKSINGLKKTCSVNLLSGYLSNKICLSIDLTPSYLIVSINDKMHIIKLNTSLKINNWYNLIINLSSIKSSITIFDLSNNINIINDVEFDLNDFKNIIIDNYQINGSNIDISNIRLYNLNIDNIDKKIINAISEYSEHESKMLIADNCDEWYDKPYYGTQR